MKIEEGKGVMKNTSLSARVVRRKTQTNGERQTVRSTLHRLVKGTLNFGKKRERGHTVSQKKKENGKLSSISDYVRRFLLPTGGLCVLVVERQRKYF